MSDEHHAPDRAHRPRVGGLVLAAGASVRFGAPKQLARFAGEPLLQRALRALTRAELVGPVVVTLGAEAEAIRAGIDLEGVRVVEVAGWREGQAASVRAGVAALADADAIAITVADLPRLRPATVDRVIAAALEVGTAARAVHAGVPGHPVVLPRALFGAARALSGDVGAKAVLAGAPVVAVTCGPEVCADVDRPADL